jgi:solute carrier family 25 citrate transporter 1
MPLDTVKTRMQSIEASKEYKNSFACAARIFREEGILTFWSGAVPRLARLIMSGGIVFTMYVFPLAVMLHWMLTLTRYEKSMELMDTLDPQGKYI